MHRKIKHYFNLEHMIKTTEHTNNIYNTFNTYYMHTYNILLVNLIKRKILPVHIGPNQYAL